MKNKTWKIIISEKKTINIKLKNDKQKQSKHKEFKKMENRDNELESLGGQMADSRGQTV